MNADHNNPEEKKFASLFARLDKDAAPVDAELKEKLRRQSAEVFAECNLPGKKIEPPRRRNRMYVLALRGLAATVTAVLVATGLWLGNNSPDGSFSLGSALESVAVADTIEMEITRDGAAEKIWVQGRDRLRWDSADGTYRIAHGQTVWDIDEKANRATSPKSTLLGDDKSGVVCWRW